MAALSMADTGDGASGCALGSHTCSGTRPAFDPKPANSTTNTNEPSPGARCAPRRVVKLSPPAAAAYTVRATSRATNPSWVITAYHQPASRTAGPRRWSATTRISEVSAISSHSTRNVETPAAHGTSTSAAAKTGSAARTPRPPGP